MKSSRFQGHLEIVFEVFAKIVNGNKGYLGCTRIWATGYYSDPHTIVGILRDVCICPNQSF